MKTTILALSVFAAALLAPAAHAQKDAAGETRAAPSKAATPDERKAARAKRQAAGKELGKEDAGRLPDTPTSAGTAKSATAEERSAARAKRQAKGKDIAKDGSGRLPDTPPGAPKN